LQIYGIIRRKYNNFITNRWYGTGEPKTRTNARSQVITHAYRTDGLPDSYTTPEGETAYSYTTENQVSGITSPGGVTRAYTYDSMGRVETISESVGGESFTESFSYDEKGRLFRKYFNGSDYEQYDYDPNSGYLYRIKFNGMTVWQVTGIDEYSRT
jgi:YD repeat-containing protein